MPFETDAGMEGILESNVKKAKELLAEAKYDGTPIVLMHSTDLAVLTNLAPVAKALLEKAGFKVDMQSMDWQTVVARRAKKDPPNAGGWHAFLTSWTAGDLLNPIATGFLNASCDSAMFGWPCDKEIEALRDQFAKAVDKEKQVEIVKSLQKRWAQYPTHVHLGQWYSLAAMRDNIVGTLQTPGVPVFWGIEKK
jgi:peptide/nickel transport system substrate-binding protein